MKVMLSGVIFAVYLARLEAIGHAQGTVRDSAAYRKRNANN